MNKIEITISEKAQKQIKELKAPDSVIENIANFLIKNYSDDNKGKKEDKIEG